MSSRLRRASTLLIVTAGVIFLPSCEQNWDSADEFSNAANSVRISASTSLPLIEMALNGEMGTVSENLWNDGAMGIYVKRYEIRTSIIAPNLSDHQISTILSDLGLEADPNDLTCGFDTLDEVNVTACISPWDYEPDAGMTDYRVVFVSDSFRLSENDSDEVVSKFEDRTWECDFGCDLIDGP